MNDEVLNEKLRELRRHKRAIEEVRQQMDAVEAEVKEELTRRGVDQVVTRDYKVTWKTVSSVRLDAKALKAERPELYARYAVASEARRFVVI